MNDQAIPRQLNLGCGRQLRAGCLNLDVRAEVAPDVCWDLDQHPYPLPADHFERVYALDVIEHLSNVPRFMEEVHRLLASGGELEVTTPHFSCANSYTDSTHRQHLGLSSLDFFVEGSDHDFSTSARFEMTERILVFHPTRLNRLVARLANQFADLYEHRFCWLFPAWFMIFRLRAIK